MGFAKHSALADAIIQGQRNFYTWRKTYALSGSTSVWQDLSMAAGNPAPNFYASEPLVAATLSGSKGLPHGGNAPAGTTKHLKSLLAMTATGSSTPYTLVLCDYLLYYPFCDMGIAEPQVMDNTVAISRYTDGKGVMMIPVMVAAQAVGNQTFYITYTNQDGVAGRITPTITCNAITNTGTLINTVGNSVGVRGPYIPLQSGDTGVRSIQNLTMIGSDVGLISLVLVRPLASITITSADGPVEKDFAVDCPSMPRIYDGAYLNFLSLPSQTASPVIHGHIETVWN